MSVRFIEPSTPSCDAYAFLLDALAHCHVDCASRVIFEMSNHPNVESWTNKAGRTIVRNWDGYLMIDFSDDFGDHPLDDGSYARVSSDFRDAENVFYRVRNPRNLYLFLCSLFDRGKMKRCYLEGY